MSLATALCWSCVRCLAIALLVWPLSRLLSEAWDATRGSTRRGLLALLFVPFLFPELWVGYAYALWLIQHPVWNELLFDLLLLLKLVPAGAVVAHLSPPPPMSAQAIHCRRLAIRSDARWSSRFAVQLGCHVRGPLRAAVPAVALVFLLAFQDYELPSLMGIKSWTVWMFDAQAGARDATTALHHIGWPLACELAVLLPALAVTLSNSVQPTAMAEPVWPLTGLRSAIVWSYLVVSATLTAAIPIAITGRGMFAGFGQLFRNQSQLASLLSNIASGFVIGALAAGLTCGVAGRLLTPNPSPPWGEGKIDAAMLPRRRAGVRWLLMLPGCLGSLVVGLLVLVLFQRTPLFVVYDTPLPLVIALAAWLLPRGVLMLLLWSGIRHGAGSHLADIIHRAPSAPVAAKGIDLMWHLRHRPAWFCWMLVSYWAYLDLTSAAMLAPTGMASAPVRLYDLMHFSRTSLLSAQTCLTLLVPVVLLWIGFGVRRQVVRWLAV
jgi:hypothetical protein